MTTSKVNVFLKQGDADQKQWTFERQFSIGRDGDADICINDPTVSRFHAFIHIVKGTWWIRDMNSSNGTFINGKQVSKHPVDRQTQLQLGQNGPQLQLSMVTPNQSDSETVLLDLSDSQIKGHCSFDRKKMTNPIIPENGSALAGKIHGHVKTYLHKWRKILPATLSVILVAPVLAGYMVSQDDINMSKKQQEIHRVENHPDSTKARHSGGNDQTDSQTKTEEFLANRTTQPNASHPAKHPVRQDGHKTIDPQQVKNDKQIADIYFNVGKKFSNHRRWRAALEYYEKVSKIDADYPLLNDEMAILDFEIKNQKTYQEALVHVKAERYKQALAKLINFPQKSAYYKEVEQLIEDVGKIRAQPAEKHKKEVTEKTSADRGKKAIDTINEALRLYAEGKTKSSINTLNRLLHSSAPAKPSLKKRANILKKRILYAKSLLKKGDLAHANGQIDSALNTWETFLSVDQTLLDSKQGYFAGHVRLKMADEYSEQARKALSDGDLPTAYRYSSMALDVRGNHPKALEVQTMLKATARRLYQRGYILEAYNAEKAMEKWKLITKICDTDTEYYQLALAKINAR
jgi:tetratricopeptide (TPR) repeat protein